MRTGILTLPFDSNYGGVLQAWALQTVLERIGHNVEVFNLKCRSYRPWYVMPFAWAYRAAKKTAGQFDASIFCEYKHAKAERQKNSLIYRFYKDRIKSRDIKSLNELSDADYDAIVVGSDQIWREKFIRYLWRSTEAENAFLYQALGSPVKKVAYAASFGTDAWTFDRVTSFRIKRALDSYIGISVREQSAVDLLRGNIGVESIQVCDPTMLLSADDYVSSFGIIHKSKCRIVSYVLDSSDLSESLISTVAHATGQSIYELNKTDVSGRLPSVEHWVETMANAEMVITDSFHGCIFSIIFRKPFIFMANNHRGNTRFSSLTEIFGLSDHRMTCAADFDIRKSYALPADIDEKIDRLRAKSFEFLYKHLRVTQSFS